MIKPLGVLALSAALLAGCGTQSASTAMTTWLTSSNLFTNSATLVLDARHAATALRAPATSAVQLHTVCGVLLLETDGVNASLPSPDGQLNTVLASAFNALGDGANECYRAGASPRLRTRAIRYLQRGVAALAEATVRAHVVEGR